MLAHKAGRGTRPQTSCFARACSTWRVSPSRLAARTTSRCARPCFSPRCAKGDASFSAERDASARATLAAFAPVERGSRFPETVPNGSEGQRHLLPRVRPSAPRASRLSAPSGARPHEGGRRTFRQRRRRPRGDARRRRVGHPAGAFARVPESSLAKPRNCSAGWRRTRRARVSPRSARSSARSKRSRRARRPIPAFSDLLESLLAMRDEAARRARRRVRARARRRRARGVLRASHGKPLDSASR